MSYVIRQVAKDLLTLEKAISECISNRERYEPVNGACRAEIDHAKEFHVTGLFSGKVGGITGSFGSKFCVRQPSHEPSLPFHLVRSHPSNLGANDPGFINGSSAHDDALLNEDTITNGEFLCLNDLSALAKAGQQASHRH